MFGTCSDGRSRLQFHERNSGRSGAQNSENGALMLVVIGMSLDLIDSKWVLHSVSIQSSTDASCHNSYDDY